MPICPNTNHLVQNCFLFLQIVCPFNGNIIHVIHEAIIILISSVVSLVNPISRMVGVLIFDN
ncbi:hypothetical protein C467_13078 [Halorubrum hochstenium ATCC 700873]|uniref:Uncharacterized protein n=1 Tax=Halorubrum hochstenium ATCC 700873 TaxID=1227481 RepID=M0F2S5_9EURY|nr:hypothetical protein C467_13078 [Halorubrum hochstenium ATCC 700873]